MRVTLFPPRRNPNSSEARNQEKNRHISLLHPIPLPRVNTPTPLLLAHVSVSRSKNAHLYMLVKTMTKTSQLGYVIIERILRPSSSLQFWQTRTKLFWDHELVERSKDVRLFMHGCVPSTCCLCNMFSRARWNEHSVSAVSSILV